VWKEVQLFEKESAGFQIELSPFGKVSCYS